MFEVEYPYLALLLLLPLLFKLLTTKSTEQGASIEHPLFDSLDKNKVLNNNKYSFSLIDFLLYLAFLFLVLASIKPVWIDEGKKIPIKGRDIMLAIDLSGSMRERDFTVNNKRLDRLSVVKIAAKKFIQSRVQDRIGLIVFGSKAYLYAPLTFDKQLIIKYLEESHINMAGQQTAIGDAIVLAIKHFRDNKKNDNEIRTLVLLTDGVSNAGAINPNRATQLAKEDNIKIHTIGLGTNKVSFFGISSSVDENTLKKIASETGGIYFRAQNTQKLQSVYDEINKLERQKLESKLYHPKKDLFHYPLAIFLLLLSILLAIKCRT